MVELFGQSPVLGQILNLCVKSGKVWLQISIQRLPQELTPKTQSNTLITLRGQEKKSLWNK
jgi:hypothetical protein